jgi:hypothetical protein
MSTPRAHNLHGSEEINLQIYPSLFLLSQLLNLFSFHKILRAGGWLVQVSRWGSHAAKSPPAILSNVGLPTSLTAQASTAANLTHSPPAITRQTSISLDDNNPPRTTGFQTSVEVYFLTTAQEIVS